MHVMVNGASTNRAKYGNKAVRAYQRAGHTVLPVNPRADKIEGLDAYPSVSDPPGPIDRATVYLPPKLTLAMLDDLAARGDVAELYLNPGAESDAVIDRARELGLNPIAACSIVAVGERP